MKVKELRIKLEELAKEGKDNLDVRVGQNCSCCWFGIYDVKEKSDENLDKFIALD